MIVNTFPSIAVARLTSRPILAAAAGSRIATRLHRTRSRRPGLRDHSPPAIAGVRLRRRRLRAHQIRQLDGFATVVPHIPAVLRHNAAARRSHLHAITSLHVSIALGRQRHGRRGRHLHAGTHRTVIDVPMRVHRFEAVEQVDQLRMRACSLHNREQTALRVPDERLRNGRRAERVLLAAVRADADRRVGRMQEQCAFGGAVRQARRAEAAVLEAHFGRLVGLHHDVRIVRADPFARFALQALRVRLDGASLRGKQIEGDRHPGADVVGLQHEALVDDVDFGQCVEDQLEAMPALREVHKVWL